MAGATSMCQLPVREPAQTLIKAAFVILLFVGIVIMFALGMIIDQLPDPHVAGTIVDEDEMEMGLKGRSASQRSRAAI